GRSLFALVHRRNRGHPMEPRQRLFGAGGNIWHSFYHANLCWNRGRRLWTDCANNSGGSFSDRDARPHHGDFLRGDPGGERIGICARWINRQSFRLALGILPSGASRLVARPALFLATRSTRRGTPSRTKIVPPAPGGLPDAV